MMRNLKLSWATCLAIILIFSVFISACSDKENDSVESDSDTTVSVTSQTVSVTSQPDIMAGDEDQYDHALDLCEAGRFFEASEIFTSLSGFRDSAQLSERAWQSILLAPVMIDGKWGYIDNHDNLVLPPVYDEANPFFDGQALVKKENEWHLIDAKGDTTGKIGENWLEVGPFSCGLATFSQADRSGRIFYGSIDYHGNVVFGAHSDIPIYFIDNTAMIMLDYEKYYLDIAGNIYHFMNLSYNVLPGFENTLQPTSDSVMSSLIIGSYKDSGPVMDAPDDIYDVDRLFYGNGYVYADGTIAIPLKFSSCGEFNHGLAPASDFSGKYGYIDRQGDYVIEPIYEEAGAFSQGLAMVKVDDLYGYINTRGEIAIEPQFYEARDFQEGLAAVRVLPFLDDQEGWGTYAGWGFVDLSGSLVIKPQFGDVPRSSGFMDGYCSAAAPISEAAWNSDWSFSNEIMKYGFIDTDGNWMVQPRYGVISGHWPGIYLADRNYYSYGIQFDGHAQSGFQTNHKEMVVEYSSNDGRTIYSYYGPDGYINELTPYDQEIQSERSRRPVEIWESLYFSLVSGDLSLAMLPRESEKPHFDMTVYFDESSNLYGFTSTDGTIDVPAKYQEMKHFGNCYSTIQPVLLRNPIEKALNNGRIESSVLSQIHVAFGTDRPGDLEREVFVVNMTLNGRDQFFLASISDMQETYEEYAGESWREFLPDYDRFYIKDYITRWNGVFSADGEFDKPQEWAITPSDRLSAESDHLSVVSIVSFASFYQDKTGKPLDMQTVNSRQQVWQLFSEIVPEEKRLNIYNRVEIDDTVYVARGISLVDHRLVYLYLQYNSDEKVYKDLLSQFNPFEAYIAGVNKVALDDRMKLMLFSEYHAMADLPLQMTHGELIAFYEASFPDTHKKWFNN